MPLASRKEPHPYKPLPTLPVELGHLHHGGKSFSQFLDSAAFVEGATRKTSSSSPLLEPSGEPEDIQLNGIPSTSQKGWKSRRRSFTGWRVGMTFCAVCASTVLLANIIWTIWSVQQYGLKGSLGTIQEGSCDGTKKLSLWLHFMINALSTILLSASNYSMQCITAPTRTEIDKAHAKHYWLDIGVPSWRNLAYIAKRRRVLWWLLALSGIPLHLLYNSAVFTTLSTTQYPLWAMDQKLTGLSPESDLQEAVNKNSDTDVDIGSLSTNDISTFDNLTISDCIRAYGRDFVSARSDLILVVDDTRALTNSSMIPFGSIGDDNGYSWMCQGYSGKIPLGGTCNIDELIVNATEWHRWQPLYQAGINDPNSIGRFSTSAGALRTDIGTGNGYLPIQYCLSRKVDEHCTVQFSITIMCIVIVSSAVKAISMVTFLLFQDEPPLVTLGDALQSFLDENDQTTRRMCLSGADRFRTTFWGAGAEPWKGQNYRWFAGASRNRWLVCNVL